MQVFSKKIIGNILGARAVIAGQLMCHCEEAQRADVAIYRMHLRKAQPIAPS